MSLFVLFSAPEKMNKSLGYAAFHRRDARRFGRGSVPLIICQGGGGVVVELVNPGRINRTVNEIAVFHGNRLFRFFLHAEKLPKSFDDSNKNRIFAPKYKLLRLWKITNQR